MQNFEIGVFVSLYKFNKTLDVRIGKTANRYFDCILQGLSVIGFSFECETIVIPVLVKKRLFFLE